MSSTKYRGASYLKHSKCSLLEVLDGLATKQTYDSHQVTRDTPPFV